MSDILRGTTRKLASLAVAVVLLAAVRTSGQVLIRPSRNEKPLPVNAAERTKVIEALLKQLDDRYVFPEVATKMRQAIEARLAQKEYDAVTTGQDLAARLTTDLQGVSKDKHLRVLCHTEKIPAPFKRARTPKELERMHQVGQQLNGGYVRAERLAGNVGYLRVDGFMNARDAAEPAAAAMSFLAHTDALIIDLRYNGGGAPESVALLCSYFFDKKPVHLNDLYWRKGNRTQEFWTLKDLPGKRYLGKPVYLLTSHHTFSGGEEFAYDLQSLKRATIIGETTGGGAHPGGAVPVGEHFMMFIPSGRAINPITKTDWEGTGVKPDIAVAADKALETAHQLAIKHLLAKAVDEETRRLIQRDLDRAKDLKRNPAR